MILKLKERFERGVLAEKELLQSGQKPKSVFKNKLQRTSVKLLAIFFSLMLTFTIFSRISDDITIARVSVETVKSGIITNRTSLNGTIKPLEDLEIYLPADIYITDMEVSNGQTVAKGDVLAVIDAEDVADQLEKQQNSLDIVNLRIAISQISTSSSDDSITSAETSLNNALADHERLLEKLERNLARAEEDLQAAKDALEEATAALDSASDSGNSNTSNNEAIAAAQQQVAAATEALAEAGEQSILAIAAAQKEYDTAVQNDNTQIERETATIAVNQAQEKLDLANETLTQLQTADPPDQTAIDAAKAAIDAAKTELESAQNHLDSLPTESADVTKARTNLANVKSEWEQKISEAEKNLEAAQKALTAASTSTSGGNNGGDQQQNSAAQSAVEQAQKSVNSLERSLEDTISNNRDQTISSERSIENAKRNLEQAIQQAENNAKNEEKTNKQGQIDNINYISEKETLEKTIATLNEVIELDGKLLSPIDGTVQSVGNTGKTQDKTPVVIIAGSELGFYFEAKVTQSVAESVVVGDQGSISFVSDGRSQQATAVITSIGGVDEEGNVPITASLPERAYMSGASAEITITKSSDKQNACLPISALRSDSGDNYVLVLRESKTILGIEYTVEKVAVTVLDRDSSLMSINSSLRGDDQIVTSSNKPVSEGGRVRLEQN